MTVLLKRNVRLFFRDRSAVFFSLLAVLVIVGLYALFLGDVWLSDYKDIDGARFLMDSWLISGLLAVTAVTATLGAFGIMVEDRAKKISKDFYSAPLRNRSLTGGYLLSVFVIGVIMSLVALVAGELYVLMNGGALLGVVSLLKVLGLIVLSALSGASMLCLIVSGFKSQNAYGTASTIIGTVIGFIAGIYLPVGNLPSSVQTIVKLFPVSHSAALFRQVMLDVPAGVVFNGAPQQAVDSFNEMMGVTYRFGDFHIEPWMSVAFLVVTTLLFFGLAMASMSRRKQI